MRAGRRQSNTPNQSCGNSAERVRGGGGAAPRGRAARHRLAPRRPRAALSVCTRPARARHYRALLQRRPCWVVRCDTQASICRARQCPICRRLSARTASGYGTETIRGPAHVLQSAPSSLNPLSRALARGGAGQPSHGGTLEVRSLVVRVRVRGGAPRVPGGTRRRAKYPPLACLLGVFFQQKSFSIVSRSVRVFVPPHRKRCVQLAAIQRSAAGKALVVGVQAKKLDLLRVVKARCRRGAPLSVLGVPHRSPGVLRTREYSSTPRSTHAAEYG